MSFPARIYAETNLGDSGFSCSTNQQFLDGKCANCNNICLWLFTPQRQTVPPDTIIRNQYKEHSASLEVDTSTARPSLIANEMVLLYSSLPNDGTGINTMHLTLLRCLNVATTIKQILSLQAPPERFKFLSCSKEIALTFRFNNSSSSRGYGAVTKKCGDKQKQHRVWLPQKTDRQSSKSAMTLITTTEGIETMLLTFIGLCHFSVCLGDNGLAIEKYPKGLVVLLIYTRGPSHSITKSSYCYQRGWGC